MQKFGQRVAFHMNVFEEFLRGLSFSFCMESPSAVNQQLLASVGSVMAISLPALHPLKGPASPAFTALLLICALLPVHLSRQS